MNCTFRRGSARPAVLLTSLCALLASLVVAPAAEAGQFLFGIQANNTVLVDGSADAQRLAVQQVGRSGAQVLRVTMSWKRVAINGAACAAATPAELRDPLHACYNWSTYDTVVKEAGLRGMRVMASIYQVPQWVLNSSDPYEMGASADDFNTVVSGWAAFSEAAAERYDGEGFGMVQYYTVGNEPNSQRFWRPYNASSPCRYAALYHVAAPAIRAGNPAAKVALGPIGPKPHIGLAPATYYARMLPCLGISMRPYLDAVAHNPYPPTLQGPRRVVHRLPVIGMTNIRELPKILDRYAVSRGKPVWATEFAYQSNPPDQLLGVSLERQATYLAEAFDVLQATGRVEIASWYVFKDNTVATDWQSGLLHSSGRAKPSYSMFKRPISRSRESIRRGQSVRIWGASLVGSNQRIYVSTNGRTWRRLVGQRRSGKLAIGTFKPSRTTLVRMQDSAGKGPARRVVVR